MIDPARLQADRSPPQCKPPPRGRRSTVTPGCERRAVAPQGPHNETLVRQLSLLAADAWAGGRLHTHNTRPPGAVCLSVC